MTCENESTAPEPTVWPTPVPVEPVAWAANMRRLDEIQQRFFEIHEFDTHKVKVKRLVDGKLVDAVERQFVDDNAGKQTELKALRAESYRLMDVRIEIIRIGRLSQREASLRGHAPSHQDNPQGVP